jgi:hypothetical protein
MRQLCQNFATLRKCLITKELYSSGTKNNFAQFAFLSELRKRGDEFDIELCFLGCLSFKLGQNQILKSLAKSKINA